LGQTKFVGDPSISLSPSLDRNEKLATYKVEDS